MAGAASITVWEGAGFRGASTTLDGSVRSLSSLGWDDRISSFRIDSGKWELCQHPDFGSCRELTVEEMSSLDGGWNDNISSLRAVDTSSSATTSADSESPEVLARRIYRAILGRDADATGLRNAASEIARGRGQTLIRSMLQSTEYKNLRTQRSSAEILDQMYRGLLGRPSDTAARRLYLAPLDRGDDVGVILDLLSSEEYGGVDIGGGATDTAPVTENDIALTASGSGLVVWGTNGRYESISGAKVALARDGRARIDFTGTTPQTLNGTWTRESDRVVRLSIPEVGGRRTNAKGWIIFDANKVAEIQITSGAPGARASSAMTFLASDYTPPAEETACYQEVRAQLEKERGAPMAMLFLTPERSRVASGRARLDGDALILADVASLSFRCEVDSRRGTVLNATYQRR